MAVVARMNPTMAHVSPIARQDRQKDGGVASREHSLPALLSATACFSSRRVDLSEQLGGNRNSGESESLSLESLNDRRT
jgi:hypothetical protein